MRSVSHRLELAQRAAIAVVLLVSAAAGIAFHFEIRFPLVRWRSGATGIAALLALALLLSALCRNRQLPVVSALVLTAAAAAGCVFADNILLGILLALGLSGAGYLTAQLFGFLLPMRWQPRIDAAAINATLLIGSISSVFVAAEILLWILTRISQTSRCIGALGLRKSCWTNGLSQDPGKSRCRQSVTRICSALQLLKDGRWWPRLTVAR